MREFDFGREDEVGEKDLKPHTIFQGEILAGNAHKVFRLAGTRIARKVNAVLATKNDEQAGIVVRPRFVSKMNGRFDENRANAFGMLLVAHHLILQATLGKREGRQQKTNIEMLSKLDVGNNTEVEARAAARLDDPHAVIAQKTAVLYNPIARGIVAEGNTKIEILFIKSKIIKIAFLSL